MTEAFRVNENRAILSSLVLLLLPAAICAPLSAQLGAPNDSGISFATVHLTVREPAEHQRLWAEMFGARTTSIGSRDVIRVPGLIFVVNEGEPTGGSAGAFVDHVGFLVPDLAAVKALVVGNDIAIVSENDELRQLTVEFPDGVKIEFTGTPELGMPISLHHVHFFVGNGEALRAWYAHTFGATASMRRIFFSAEFPGGRGFPGPELDFLTARGERSPNDGRAIDRIGVEVQGLEKLLARLEGEGVTIEVPYQAQSGLGVKRAVIVDPTGTRIELTEGLPRR
jgi:catechol 2,3-dioxygenase-like lactoylglutathione lyase family enzyme